MATPRRFLGLHLLCLDGPQNVAGLGDVGEIDFRNDALGSFGRRGAGAASRVLAALKMRANLVGLIVFQRTGVGLAACQAEFRQYVKNLLALDFHLAREIVDSNLTHPPLFKICYPKPTSRS
jgi:hypothetical protein